MPKTGTDSLVDLGGAILFTITSFYMKTSLENMTSTGDAVSKEGCCIFVCSRFGGVVPSLLALPCFSNANQY